MENPPHMSLTRALWRGCAGGFCPQRACLQARSQPSALGRRVTAQSAGRALGWSHARCHGGDLGVPAPPPLRLSHTSSKGGQGPLPVPRPCPVCSLEPGAAPPPRATPCQAAPLPPSHAGADPGLEASLGGCTFSHGPLTCSANTPKHPRCALALSGFGGGNRKQERGAQPPELCLPHGPARWPRAARGCCVVGVGYTRITEARLEPKDAEGRICAFCVTVCRALDRGATTCYGNESCPFSFLSDVATSTPKPHMWL